MSVTPVPPGWYRDAAPRSQDELIADHLADVFARRWAERGHAALMLDLVAAAFDRIDSMPSIAAAATAEGKGREVFSAALLAVLAQGAAGDPPPRHEPAIAQAMPARCGRPACERSTGHDAWHKGSENEPLCSAAQQERGEFTGRVCVREMGHLGHHSYVMWYQP